MYSVCVIKWWQVKLGVNKFHDFGLSSQVSEIFDKIPCYNPSWCALVRILISLFIQNILKPWHHLGTETYRMLPHMYVAIL